MKSILLPVHPEILKNILNGNADTLIRKIFPKDYVGWVYCYCTKGKNDLHYDKNIGFYNGKVVARFWCDNVEEIKLDKDFSKIDEKVKNTIGKAGLSLFQAFDYLQGKNGCAIHISKREVFKVFDRPKELREFWNGYILYDGGTILKRRLTKVPPNYCYIESEE